MLIDNSFDNTIACYSITESPHTKTPLLYLSEVDDMMPSSTTHPVATMTTYTAEHIRIAVLENELKHARLANDAALAGSNQLILSLNTLITNIIPRSLPRTAKAHKASGLRRRLRASEARARNAEDRLKISRDKLDAAKDRLSTPPARSLKLVARLQKDDILNEEDSDEDMIPTGTNVLPTANPLKGKHARTMRPGHDWDHESNPDELDDSTEPHTPGRCSQKPDEDLIKFDQPSLEDVLGDYEHPLSSEETATATKTCVKSTHHEQTAKELRSSTTGATEVGSYRVL